MEDDARIHSLEQKIARMQAQINDMILRPRIFLAKSDGSVWKEQSGSGGEIHEYTRQCDSVVTGDGCDIIFAYESADQFHYVRLKNNTFVAELGAGSQDGSNMRWSYPFTEQSLASDAYGGWSAKSGGRTGTARNWIEDMNGTEAAGNTFGNGVDPDNYSGTSLHIVKAPSGVLVVMHEISLPDNSLSYWFQYENAIDGSC